VSSIVEDFRARGMLKTEQGRVFVGDRERLLEASCDCYGVIRDNYDQVGR
jgi:hypothetical protein